MSDFFIIRLGKDSVNEIRRLDALREVPSSPPTIKIDCAQVPKDFVSGKFVFICFGSDNNKGQPIDWVRGLRAFGILEGRSGGLSYSDVQTLVIRVTAVLSRSLTHKDFLASAPTAYFWFSEVPIIGVDTHSQQTVQKIDGASPNQNVGALIFAIQLIQPAFKAQLTKSHPELIPLFEYTPPAPDAAMEGHLLSTTSAGINGHREGSSEEIDGIDRPSESFGWGDYPLDSVFVRTEQRTVSEVVRRIKGNRYDLNPDFQREFLWPIEKQSRLIESCLMRIPLPVFYVAEARDGRIIVVDGLQRLTTFRRFLDNEFKLTFTQSDESDSHPLSGRNFKDLQLNLQERIEDSQLTLYVLDAKAPDRAKLDIFERVNSGEPLTRQQMRNCLYNGKATQWLKRASEDPAFLRVTGGSLDRKKMRDREVINRFCAFRLLGWRGYSAGDMDSFLAAALEQMNTSNQEQLDAMQTDFKRSMINNYGLFRAHAFRKSFAADPGAGRSVLNVALFDVCSVLLADLSEKDIERVGKKLSDIIRSLIQDSTFAHAISYSTNSKRQVWTRFEMMERAVNEVLQ